MLREIKFLCLERSAEDFADMMMDAGAMSVSIEDADLGSPDERPFTENRVLNPIPLPGTVPSFPCWQTKRSMPLRPPPSPPRRLASKRQS